MLGSVSSVVASAAQPRGMPVSSAAANPMANHAARVGAGKRRTNMTTNLRNRSVKLGMDALACFDEAPPRAADAVQTNERASPQRRRRRIFRQRRRLGLIF